MCEQIPAQPRMVNADTPLSVSSPQQGLTSQHSVHLFDKDTLKPRCPPFRRELSFSTAHNQTRFPYCHIRGEFIVFTCQVLDGAESMTNIVKLFHWRTGILLFEVSGAAEGRRCPRWALISPHIIL
jgi:hypothetical protein